MAEMSSKATVWSCALKCAKYVVAPMVDQSELAWRLLSRRYGAHLCYTPMLHASVFRRDPNYRKENLVTCAEDRPLIVQFCANDPHTLLEAARYAQSCCDAVDINLGCPQTIAKKGHYGAFLQDEWELISQMVKLLHQELTVPVTCKIRVFESIAKTVAYAQMLEVAGCQLLTVHGRTRDQKGVHTGLASWEHIKAVKQNVNIPVFANGNIQFLSDAEMCLKETGVEGIMSAEGNLFNPALFAGEQPPCWLVSEEYLTLVRQHSCSLSFVRGHLFKLWYHVLKLPEYQRFRERLGVARSIDSIEQVIAELKALLLVRLTDEELTAEFSLSKIPFWRCQPCVRPPRSDSVDDALKKAESLSEEVVLARKERKKRDRRDHTQTLSKKRRWVTCRNCTSNPKGVHCEHDLCKLCCRIKCRAERLGCEGHRFSIKTPAVEDTGCKEDNTNVLEPTAQSEKRFCT